MKSQAKERFRDAFETAYSNGLNLPPDSLSVKAATCYTGTVQADAPPPAAAAVGAGRVLLPARRRQLLQGRGGAPGPVTVRVGFTIEAPGGARWVEGPRHKRGSMPFWQNAYA
jgi:hypothetical protein